MAMLIGCSKIENINKNIIMQMGVKYGSSIIDVTKLEDTVEMSSLIIRGTIINVSDPDFTKGKNPIFTYTVNITDVCFDLHNVYRNDNTVSQQLEYISSQGYILAEDYYSNMSDQEKQKFGVINYDNDDYIAFSDFNSIIPELQKEYILFLRYSNGKYAVASDYYIMEVNQEKMYYSYDRNEYKDNTALFISKLKETINNRTGEIDKKYNWGSPH